MKKLFSNSNGRNYCVVKGGFGKRSLLVNMDIDEYVVCAILEENSWWQGHYFSDFDEAYKYYEEV